MAIQPVLAIPGYGAPVRAAAPLRCGADVSVGRSDGFREDVAEADALMRDGVYREFKPPVTCRLSCQPSSRASSTAIAETSP